MKKKYDYLIKRFDLGVLKHLSGYKKQIEEFNSIGENGWEIGI